MTSPRPSTEIQARLRTLPAVEAVARRLVERGADGGVPSTDAIRAALDELRRRILAGEDPPRAADAVADVVERAWRARRASPYPRVVNATGVLLHTGLGRAPLAAAAVEALRACADGPTRLEVDAEHGARSRREDALLEDLLALTGAASGTVVNNNAAALLLALSALGAGREVLVSRGELVEIGGGFRLPDVMARSGARLVEVGTTNRTYAHDYERAATPDSALLLRVHTSNFRIVGFQHAPARDELVGVARRLGIPFYEDVGSGLLGPSTVSALHDEPDVRSAIAAGADLVSFSGDKLLGGPQAGVIVGRAELVARCRAHPLFRVVRPDRLQLVALAATLRLLRDDPARVPVVAALARTPRERLEHARALAEALGARFPRASFVPQASRGHAGSGSVPARELPSAAVAVEWPGMDGEALAARLRAADPPVFSRVWRGRCELDVLALVDGDEARVVSALCCLPDGAP